MAGPVTSDAHELEYRKLKASYRKLLTSHDSIAEELLSVARATEMAQRRQVQLLNELSRCDFVFCSSDVIAREEQLGVSSMVGRGN